MRYKNIHSIFRSGLMIMSLFIWCYANAQIPDPLPVPYTAGTAVNYIRIWDAACPETDASALVNRGPMDVKQSTQYFDGLGRPLQTVVKKGALQTDPSSPTSSATATDLVSTVVYDVLGREAIKYLPYAESSLSDGLFKLNPFDPQANFYNVHLSGQSGETYVSGVLNWAYSKTEFESSPFSRIEKSKAPGSSWNGSDRGVEMKYWNNTSADDVKIWTVDDASGGMGSYLVAGIYPAGELFKYLTVDEHGRQVVEFKDKEGKVLLKKVQLGVTAGVADDGSGRPCNDNWLCTYYIYDDLSRLRCVIQPEGVKWLYGHNWTFTSADYNVGQIVSEQCFRYIYDDLNRMVVKKVPGAGEVWMVYDMRDRLVLVQDANLRNQGKWMYTTYDNTLNRPNSTGLWTTSFDRVQQQNIAGSSIAYPDASGSSFEELTTTFYDNYNWRAAYSNPLSNTYNTSYDTHFQNSSNSLWPYPQANDATTALKGLSTGSRVKVMGTSVYIYSVIFYDKKGRVIQVQTTNISGGTDITSTQYTWAGQPLVIVSKTKKEGTGQQETVVVTNNIYDELGRLVKVEKKQSNSLISGGVMSGYKTLLKNQYDKLGQLIKKELGTNASGNAALESLNYDYNIRGWMLGMNRSSLNMPGQYGSSRFGFELGYDKPVNTSGSNFSTPQYNGNISGMVWKSDGDDVRRKYDFSYDAANRLLKGDFKQDNGGSAWDNTQMNYSMQMGNGSDPWLAYDANGNIKGMTQYGWKLGGSTTTPIDNLTYNYYDNSNRLKNVIDISNDPATRLGDFRTSTLHTQAKTVNTIDYTYDLNGNLKKDLNKDIGTATVEGIVYNHLNLPQTITVQASATAIKGTITYTYDAAGNKLQKTVTETGQPTKTTLYMGGAVYENDVLQFFVHEEGRMRPISLPSGGLGWAYDYMLKDHLGNVRMVLTEEQQQLYYPASTLEGSTAVGTNSLVNYEKLFYTIEDAKLVNKPWTSTAFDYQNNNGNPPYNMSYPSGATPAASATSTKVYKLNATTNTISNKTGLGVVIKVMSGDAVNIFGKSYHKKPTAGYSSTTNSIAVQDLINAFVTKSIVASKGATGAQITSQPEFPATLGGLIGSQPAQTSNLPRAAINWIVLDEQFKWVTGGFDMVGTATNTNGTLKHHNNSTIPTINVQKNGYIYVWVSNESKYDVFFDNLQVIHNRGPVLEETHYYPFGLTMAGISSKSFAFGMENKKLFNSNEIQNNEFSDGSGLRFYDFNARTFDQQIGRFGQIDPIAGKFISSSPYNYVDNNPISRKDPDGKDWFKNEATGAIEWRAISGKQGEQISLKGSQDTWTNLGSELMQFNGESLTLFWQTTNDNGNLTLESYSYSAVSGMGVDIGNNKIKFDYSKESQTKKNFGPIPEGLYSISTHIFDEKTNPSGWQDWLKYMQENPEQRIIGAFGRGTWPGGKKSWGTLRWELKVEDADTYGRSGMYLHGGDVWGSRGCIDVGNKIESAGGGFKQGGGSVNGEKNLDKVYLQVIYPQEKQVIIQSTPTSNGLKVIN